MKQKIFPINKSHTSRFFGLDAIPTKSKVVTYHFDSTPSSVLTIYPHDTPVISK